MHYWIRFASSWIGVLPLFIGLVNFKKLSPSLKIILYSCAMYVVVERVLFYFWQNHFNNIPFFHIFTAVEFILFTYFFRQELKSIINPKLFDSISIIFVLFTIINAIYFQSIFKLNSYAKTLESFFFIVFALISYYSLLYKNTSKNLNYNSLFWVSCAVLIYSAGSLILIIVAEFIDANYPDISKMNWAFHSFLNILFFCLISIPLWKPNKM